jgi:hypothetical protein
MATDEQASAPQGLYASGRFSTAGSGGADLGAKSKKNKKNKNTPKSKRDDRGSNNDAHAEDAADVASNHNYEASKSIVCDCSWSCYFAWLTELNRIGLMTL